MTARQNAAHRSHARSPSRDPRGRRPPTLVARARGVLTTVKGAILSLGAVAAAVAAIIALIPKGSPGPAQIAATFLRPISVYPQTTLYEYAARAKETQITASARPQTRSSALRLAAVTLSIPNLTATARTAQPSTESTTTATTISGSITTTSPTTSSGPTTTTTPATSSSVTTPPSSSSMSPQISSLAAQVIPLVSGQDLDRTAQSLQQTLAAQGSNVDVPASCTTDYNATRCGLTSLYQGALQGGRQPAGAARSLAAMFTTTRTKPIGDRLQPLGVMVAFRLHLVGFQGKLASVLWSLYPAPSAEWLKTITLVRIRAHRADETISSQFWVPVPKAKGHYFVHLLVKDEHNTMRDFIDSSPFQ